MVSPREGDCDCHIGFYLSFETHDSHDSFLAWKDLRIFLSEHISATKPKCHYHERFYSDDE